MKLPTRITSAFVVLLGATVLTMAQEPPPPPDRYVVAANLPVYAQASPKEALASTLKALDKGRIDYFAAHLLDPGFVDARVIDRARLLEDAVEREFRVILEQQRITPPETGRLPLEPAAFLQVVQNEARVRAFRIVVREIRDAMVENPDHVKDLRRFLREAEALETGETAKMALPDVKDRAVLFRKIGPRWFVMDARQESAPPEKK